MKKINGLVCLAVLLTFVGCGKKEKIPVTNNSITTTKENYKSRSSSKESISFSDEEYAAAAYMAVYLKSSTTNESVDDIFYSLTKEPAGNISFSKEKDGFVLGQEIEGSQMTFQVEKNKIHRVSPEKDNLSWSKDDLNKNFNDYEKLVEKLVVIGKENHKNDIKEEAKTTTKEIIDTKKLTENQAIDWIKNYLVANGGTAEEIDKNNSFQTDMVDGNLIISEYLPVPTGAFNKLTYQYRINSDGYLEMTDVSTSEDWHIISESYISKEDLNAPKAQKNDLLANISQEGSEGPGMFYTLNITNTIDKSVTVSSDDITFSKNSNHSEMNDQIPLRYKKTVIIPARKTYEFSQILGPVSGDTPMYYNLDVLYQSEVIIHQEPVMKEYR